MKKFKDFLYNWNDIIVILCVIIAAAAIIYWRVNVIMDYPRVIAMQVQAATQAAKEEAEALTPITQDGQSSNDSSTVTIPPSTTTTQAPGAGPINGRLWSGGMLREEVTVTTASGSAQDAAESLVSAGLFTSYEDFEAVCEINGYDPTDIKANTFTFPPGTTQAQIAEEVTRPMG